MDAYSVVVHEELGSRTQSESGLDVDATSNGHELAVALSPVKGIDEPSNKMPASEPGIGAFEGWFAVEADRRAGHPFDVMISL